MNIRCPNCETTFRVDPARVPAAGIRARCARCSATFRVTRNGAGAGAPTADHPVASPPAGTSQATRPAASHGGTDGGTDAAPARSEAAAHGTATTTPAPPAPPTPGPGESRTDDPPTGTGSGSPSAGRQAWPASEPAAPGAPSGAQAGQEQATQAPPPTQATSPDPGPQATRATPPAQAPQASEPARASGEGQPGSAPAGAAESADTFTGDSSPGRAGAAIFGSRDPNARAQRIARALVSDIVAYHPKRRDACLEAGTLRTEFREEIMKSWEEYVAQVGLDMAKSTPYFRDALNAILARGQAIF